jgi:hypothetical protein
MEAGLREVLLAAQVDGPNPAEVGAYVDGSMDPLDRAAFEELRMLDPALREEVDDLRELDQALRSETRRSRRWPAWAGLAAAAAVAAILLRPSTSPKGGPGPSALPARPILTLHDGGVEVSLRTDGSLDGLPALPKEMRAMVVEALRDGSLPEAEALGFLRSGKSALLGRQGASSFKVISPRATLVRSDRPTFRWEPKTGARAYELVVFTEDLTRMADVRVSNVTEAALKTPLPRGQTYLWQVAAITREGREVAPAPPEPEARFRVLSAPESEALEKSLAAAGNSDLVASVLLARAGLRDEAETRLARLAAANPNAIAVFRMLEAIRR